MARDTEIEAAYINRVRVDGKPCKLLDTFPQEAGVVDFLYKAPGRGYLLARFKYPQGFIEGRFFQHKPKWE
jgi:hypothetical protein